MYLSIPDGMVFQQKQVIQGDKTVLNDFFVDPKGIKADINIQEIIKKAIQCNTGRSQAIENKYPFNIYLKVPKCDTKEYLKYIPNHNGKYATERVDSVIRVIGIRAQPLRTIHNTLWFNHVPVSADRLEEISEKREAQRHNRRHYGDSPCPT